MDEEQKTHDAQEIIGKSAEPPKQHKQAAGDKQGAPIKETRSPSTRKSTSRPKKSRAKKPARTDPKEGQTVGDYLQEQDRKAAAGEVMTAAELEREHLKAFQKMIEVAQVNIEELKIVSADACRSVLGASKNTYSDATIDSLVQSLNRLYDMYAEMQKRQEAFLRSVEWETIKTALPELTEDDGRLIELTDLTGPVLVNLPLMHERITLYQADHGGKLKLSDLLVQEDPDGLTFYEIITGARQGAYKMDLQTFPEPPEAETEPPAAARKLPKVNIQKAAAIQYPLDKLNSYIWQLLEDTGGQLTFAMEGRPLAKGKRKKASNTKLDCIYSIDFGALEEDKGVRVTRRLTPTDKRVYIAVSALFNAGNEVMTLRQIYYAMGRATTSNPNPKQLETINESISKMARAWVTIDDRAEHDAYNYDIDEHLGKGGWTGGRYDGSLLPIERGAVISNGKLSEAAIHVFREPPIMTFARLKNQITSLNPELLQAPISKTDTNLAIEDYLLTRIKRADNAGKHSEKILFETLCKRTNITDRKAKERTPDKVEKCISYYKKQGLIKRCAMERDSVTVFF